MYIYTDGSCLGNPGPGGYAIIIRLNGKQFEVGEGFPNTTNNQMELLAAVMALETVTAIVGSRDVEIQMYLDSNYVINPVENNWLTDWKNHGWKNKSKRPVMNLHLWKRMDAVLTKLNVRFNYVAGHSGNIYNERCDVTAKNYAKMIQLGE
ncbi:MAG: ribonuclease HI [Clostridia bacterium]